MIQIANKSSSSLKHDFYVEQAAQCGADAARSSLHNVRERCLRAEAAWLAMAALSAAGERSRTEAAEGRLLAESTPTFGRFA
ncbi:hypothetical protein [Aurantimonas sp. Leaf443]|uniref:hypothetical protein n=1 Tax=Aurantimonas sp. Leaf443 TaxID=1736378 RepID=UPI0006FD6495|nr:hypothetical protein [Aurantimonas sp. Leaf443]KQT85251.1 hypothetical protein ASG48_08300 [Aurantimonas sp. Leaf443]